jgi:tetratricopeptide (TPR) repeat protein
MIEPVAAAFERKDYRTAAKLLKQLLKQSPENPWVQFYLGRLHEVWGKYEQAEKVYRQLLQNTTNVKIITQARQALQRLQELEQQQRKRAIMEASKEGDRAEFAVLVLEPVSKEFKTQAAQKLARIMQMDTYSARLLLPSRGWRLFRSGALAELKFYGQQLRKAGVACFWATLAALEKIQVFQVCYFTQFYPKAAVVCQNQAKELGYLYFDWSEVKGRVQGLLPIFEEVVDRDVRGKLKRKTQTQDYLQFCDLHLPGKQCILRLYDCGYQFQQGIELGSCASEKSTIAKNWSNLLALIDQKLPEIKIWSDFTPFAETALEQTEVLDQIQPHIYLLRREKTNWDPAFQLYSGLIFLSLSSTQAEH